MDTSDGLEASISLPSSQPSASEDRRVEVVASLFDSGAILEVANEGENQDAGSLMDKRSQVQNPGDGTLAADAAISVGNQDGAVGSGTRDFKVDSSSLGESLELKIGVVETEIESGNRVVEKKELLKPEDNVAAIEASKSVENQDVSVEIGVRDSGADSFHSVVCSKQEIETLDRAEENLTGVDENVAEEASEVHTQQCHQNQDIKPVDVGVKEGIFARVDVDLTLKASDGIIVRETEVVKEARDAVKCTVHNVHDGAVKVVVADDENGVTDSRVEREDYEFPKGVELGAYVTESNVPLLGKTSEKQIAGSNVAEVGVSVLSENQMTSGPAVDMDASLDIGNGKFVESCASDVGVSFCTVSSPAVNLGTSVVDEDEQKTDVSDITKLGTRPCENPMVANPAVESDTHPGTDANYPVEINGSKRGFSLFKEEENQMTGCPDVALSAPAVTNESLHSEVRATIAATSHPDDFQSKRTEEKEVGSNGEQSLVNVNPETEVKAAQDGTLKTEYSNVVQLPILEEMQNVELSSLGTASIKDEWRASYYLPQEKKGQFSVSDLVWGKVRSHPWWPGQIFDPSDSSEMAIKYKRKGAILVAYFGDHTFAWCEESQLKPFCTHFPQMEKQSTSEAFVNAVNCALDEVSRRVELGLTCSCMPEEVRDKVMYQRIENAGIREGANGVGGSDISVFEPGRLLEYVKELALLPLNGGERLDLAIARPQLLSFYRSKGYLELPSFLYGGLIGNDPDISVERKPSDDAAELTIPVPSFEDQAPPSLNSKEKARSQDRSSHKRNQISEDGLHRTRKQKSMAELMSVEKASSTVNGGKSSADRKAPGKSGTSPSSKKRKAVDSLSDDSVQTRKKRLSSLSDTNDKASSKKRSFIVGDCIRRIAGQLTGSPPILKFSGERFQNNAVKTDSERDKAIHASGFSRSSKEKQKRKIEIPKEYSSPDALLSQLCLAARDPMKGYSFLSVVVSFFTDFRNSVHQEDPSSGKKTGSGNTSRRKLSDSKIRSLGLSELTEMEDSYWTDRIIHGDSEEEPSQQSRKRKGESQMEGPKKRGRPARKQSKSLQSGPKFDSDQKPQVKDDVNGEDECSPTALILFFNAADSVPSETDLSNIFSQYGPLKESQVMRKSNHAKVVFKRRSDAEVAFSSAGKFSIFGPALVSYRLKYLPSKPKSSNCATRRGKKDETSVEGNNLIPPLPEKDDTGQTIDESGVAAQMETKEWCSL